MKIEWNFIITLFSGVLIGLTPQIVLFFMKNKREEEIKKREASAEVVELLSEWIRSSYTGDHSNESRWKLQSLYWKTILRSDNKILKELLPRLANNKDAPNTNEIIIKCRQVLLGLKSRI